MAFRKKKSITLL